MGKAKYSPSRLQGEKECFYCGKLTDLDRHEFLSGPNRRLAAEDGLWVYVCRSCHNRVQNDASAMNAGRAFSQRVYEREIGTRIQYFERYKKNYIDNLTEVTNS